MTAKFYLVLRNTFSFLLTGVLVLTIIGVGLNINMAKPVLAASDDEWLSTIGYPYKQTERWCVVQGYNTNHTHNSGSNERYGLDLVYNNDSEATKGREVIAAADGYAQGWPLERGYTARLYKDYNGVNGLNLKYTHLDETGLNPKINTNQLIKKGEVMGRVLDDFPNGDWYHLHWSLEKGQTTPIEFKYGVWNLTSNGSENQYNGNCYTNPIPAPALPGTNPSGFSLPGAGPEWKDDYYQVNIRTAINSNFMVAEGGGGGVVNANRTAPGLWESFNLQKLSDNTTAIRASNGQYVVAEGGGGGAVNANRNAIGGWEIFTMEHYNYNVSATNNSLERNSYFNAIHQGGTNLLGNSTNATGTWEQFRLIPVPGKTNTFYIQTYHGPMLSAYNGGGGSVSPSAFNFDIWEEFKFIAQDNGKYAIQTYNGRYLQALNGGGGEVTAGAGGVGTYEQFAVNPLGNNIYTFQAYNGQYWIAHPQTFYLETNFDTFLQAYNGGGSSVNANGSVKGTWERFKIYGTAQGFDFVSLAALNGQWVAAELGNAGKELNANRNAVGPYETFVLSQLNRGKIGFRAMNNQYIRYLQGTTAFRTYNNRYLMANNGGGSWVNAAPTVPSGWEAWRIDGRGY